MLKQFWVDEGGDIVANLGVLATVGLGLFVVVSLITQAVQSTGTAFKSSIDGVTIGR